MAGYCPDLAPCLSHRMYLWISSRKSIPPPNRQLIVYHYLLKYYVDGFVGELAFWKYLINCCVRYDRGLPKQHFVQFQKEGTIKNISRNFTLQPRPGSGLDCLTHAKFDSGRRGCRDFPRKCWAMVGLYQAWRSYRGTSLIRNRHPLGTCSRTIPRALWWS